MINYDFYQYPRGEGWKCVVLNTSICPTITTCTWQNNFFMIKEYE